MLTVMAGSLALVVRRIERGSVRAILPVLSVADLVAAERGHRRTGVHHLALGLISDPDVASELEARRVDLVGLFQELDALVPPEAAGASEPKTGQVDAALRRLMRLAMAGASLPLTSRALLMELLVSGPPKIVARFEAHGITANAWRTRVEKPPCSVPGPSLEERGPYRGACGPRAHVVLWDDTKTSMTFVVELLRETFGLIGPFAIRAMLATHRDGRGVVGTYDAHEAHRLVDAATRIARERGFPLRITIEETPQRSDK
jgi:ATP-dependent Clp protease adaptor protein ClpS